VRKPDRKVTGVFRKWEEAFFGLDFCQPGWCQSNGVLFIRTRNRIFHTISIC